MFFRPIALVPTITESLIVVAPQRRDLARFPHDDDNDESIDDVARFTERIAVICQIIDLLQKSSYLLGKF